MTKIPKNPFIQYAAPVTHLKLPNSGKPMPDFKPTPPGFGATTHALGEEGGAKPTPPGGFKPTPSDRLTTHALGEEGGSKAPDFVKPKLPDSDWTKHLDRVTSQALGEEGGTR